eukprot:jgi/Astpho2/4712/Aster-00269
MASTSRSTWQAAVPVARPASRSLGCRVSAAAVMEIPREFKKVTPKGDIVSVGDGRVGDLTYEMTLSPGDTVVYSKFGIGTTDLDVQGETHTLLREDDCIGIMPRSGATAADIPQLRPVGDRVLIKVQEQASVTAGGLMLPENAREKPISGTVIRVGPGKKDKDGTRKTPKVKEGDKVLYFKWAGENMETPSGEQFVVVHEQDILCKQT